jgi:hypothetical protein
MINFRKGYVHCAAIVAAGLFFGLGFAASPATAFDRQAAINACSGDAMRLCNDFIPDEAKTTACMRRKMSQVSAGCRAVAMGGKAGARPSRKHRRHG